MGRDGTGEAEKEQGGSLGIGNAWLAVFFLPHSPLPIPHSLRGVALLDTIPPPVRMAREVNWSACPLRTAAMKCQKCTNAASLPIRERLSEDHVDELPMLRVCADHELA